MKMSHINLLKMEKYQKNIIVIINLLLIVLKNGMDILNVSLPEKM